MDRFTTITRQIRLATNKLKKYSANKLPLTCGELDILQETLRSLKEELPTVCPHTETHIVPEQAWINHEQINKQMVRCVLCNKHVKTNTCYHPTTKTADESWTDVGYGPDITYTDRVTRCAVCNAKLDSQSISRSGGMGYWCHS